MNKNRLIGLFVFCGSIGIFIYSIVEKKTYLSHGTIITYDERPVSFVLALALNVVLILLSLFMVIRSGNNVDKKI